jgi:hypothetical protein
MSTLERTPRHQEGEKAQLTGAVDDAWSKYASIPIKAFAAIADGETIPNIFNSVNHEAQAIAKDPLKLWDATKDGASYAEKFVKEECRQYPQAASFLLGMATAAVLMKVGLRRGPAARITLDDHSIAGFTPAETGEQINQVLPQNRPAAAPELDPGFDNVRIVNADAFATKPPFAREIAPSRGQGGDEISANPSGHGAADGGSTRRYLSLSAELERVPVVPEPSARPASLSSRLGHAGRVAAMPKAPSFDDIIKQQAEMRAAGQSTGFSPSPWSQFDQAVEAVRNLAK